MTRAMPLADLVAALPGARVRGRVGGVTVRDVTADSRKVKRGSVFFCFKGSRHDGRTFVPQAVRTGAVAIVAGHPVRAKVPVVLAGDLGDALARSAAAFWGYPSRRMDVVGITGTNGKSTTAFMLESILRAAGVRAGLVGTILYRLGAKSYPAVHTTPMADELQRLLADMLSRGASAVAMEVSSHALAQGRVDGTSFRGGVFTNLTRDHLDYHGTMARYFAAKSLLFSRLPGAAEGGFAALNWDNREGRAMARLTAARVAGFSAAGRKPPHGVYALEIRPGSDGISFKLAEGGARVRVRLLMAGLHNVANALGAAAAARALGVPLPLVARGLGALSHVPGRMEHVPLRAPFPVIVDYAHTPDALDRVLRAVRPHARRRVLAVFGCGGDRDRTKRPLMGRIATELADFTWVTSDNPRGEDPDAIIREITAGISRSGRYVSEPDRRSAIRMALEAARAGDVLVVAGKGHERGQVVGGRVIPFVDSEVVRDEWRRVARA